ncbi:MAG: hypothetical protein HKN25_07970 [Pyrinomonadaceae bacterium]|nr:hypothetical protein [Pyrinomonadaceae bacterium]
MLDDNKLEQEERERMRNYKDAKRVAESEVHEEIAEEAENIKAERRDDARNIAELMQEKAVDEVAQTNREVERGRVVARVSQIVDYLFFLIYGLLSIRLLLELFAARESAGFVKFIKTATGLLHQPFAGIVPSPTVEGGFTLALPIVVAIVVYVLIHLAINNLLRIFAHRKTTV